MRHRFVHLVSVARYSDQVVDRQRTGGAGLSTVIPAVECLVEPQATHKVQTKIGRVTLFDHVMTWGEEDIRASDVVTWGGRRFIVQRIIPDTSRPFSSIPPYHVAELLEQVART